MSIYTITLFLRKINCFLQQPISAQTCQDLLLSHHRRRTGAVVFGSDTQDSFRIQFFRYFFCQRIRRLFSIRSSGQYVLNDIAKSCGLTLIRHLLQIAQIDLRFIDTLGIPAVNADLFNLLFPDWFAQPSGSICLFFFEFLCKRVCFFSHITNPVAVHLQNRIRHG